MMSGNWLLVATFLVELGTTAWAARRPADPGVGPWHVELRTMVDTCARGDVPVRQPATLRMQKFSDGRMTFTIDVVNKALAFPSIASAAFLPIGDQRRQDWALSGSGSAYFINSDPMDPPHKRAMLHGVIGLPTKDDEGTRVSGRLVHSEALRDVQFTTTKQGPVRYDVYPCVVLFEVKG